jgi:hypothetical protein
MSALYMIVDGTRVISQSDGITRAIPGHNHNSNHIPRVNKIYIMSQDGEYGYPAFYRNVDGNIPDVCPRWFSRWRTPA